MNDIVNYLELNEYFFDIEIHNIIDDNVKYLTIQISYTFNDIRIEKSNFALYKQKFNRFKNLKDLLD